MKFRDNNKNIANKK